MENWDIDFERGTNLFDVTAWYSTVCVWISLNFYRSSNTQYKILSHACNYNMQNIVIAWKQETHLTISCINIKNVC